MCATRCKLSPNAAVIAQSRKRPFSSRSMINAVQRLASVSICACSAEWAGISPG
ncbi:Uncharacterised protein [Vibrio cholerae]|nr:Uncharacterised protein [Vibrio cholerae]CSI47685.1 Uncharacterised protein [Vibrio cholerae]